MSKESEINRLIKLMEVSIIVDLLSKGVPAHNVRSLIGISMNEVTKVVKQVKSYLKN